LQRSTLKVSYLLSRFCELSAFALTNSGYLISSRLEIDMEVTESPVGKDAAKGSVDAEKIIQELTKKIKQSENVVRDAKRDKQDARNDNLILKKQIKDLQKASNVEIKDLKNTIESLKAQSLRKTEEDGPVAAKIAFWKDKALKYKDQNVELKLDAKEFKRNISNFKDELAEAKDKTKELEDENEKLANKVANITRAWSKAKAKLRNKSN
ncbi:hypothetical protein GGS26DRAFT_602485, partial [Hypomontagnella submonticulosa]